MPEPWLCRQKTHNIKWDSIEPSSKGLLQMYPTKEAQGQKILIIHQDLQHYLCGEILFGAWNKSDMGTVMEMRTYGRYPVKHQIVQRGEKSTVKGKKHREGKIKYR